MKSLLTISCSCIHIMDHCLDAILLTNIRAYFTMCTFLSWLPRLDLNTKVSSHCAPVALIGVAGLLVLGHYLSRCKPLITLVTLQTLDLTVTSSLMLQGLGPTSESLATNTALVRPLVLSAASCATSNGWWRLCWNHTGHTWGCTAVIGQDVVIELLGLGRPTKALIWPALLSKSLKKRPW